MRYNFVLLRVLPQWQTIAPLIVQFLNIVSESVWCTLHTQKMARAFPKWQTLIWWAGFTQYPGWADLYQFVRKPGQYETSKELLAWFETLLALKSIQEFCFRHLQVTKICTFSLHQTTKVWRGIHTDARPDFAEFLDQHILLIQVQHSCLKIYS